MVETFASKYSLKKEKYFLRSCMKLIYAQSRNELPYAFGLGEKLWENFQILRREMS